MFGRGCHDRQEQLDTRLVDQETLIRSSNGDMDIDTVNYDDIWWS